MRQHDLSPHDARRDASFAALPNVIVIDGGKGQLAAGMRVLDSFHRRGVAIISLAKRIEEVFVPGRAEPTCSSGRSASPPPTPPTSCSAR